MVDIITMFGQIWNLLVCPIENSFCCHRNISPLLYPLIMFVLVHRETLKVGSFFATLEEAKARIALLGSIGSKYGIIDAEETPYTMIDASKFDFIE